MTFACETEFAKTLSTAIYANDSDPSPEQLSDDFFFVVENGVDVQARKILFNGTNVPAEVRVRNKYSSRRGTRQYTNRFAIDR